MRRLVLLLFFLTLGPVAGADVVDSSPNGFTTKTVSEISALPRSRVPCAHCTGRPLVDPQHTWSEDARNMAIDPRAGGCFCEKLSNSGSVQHMIVILAEPGKTLRIRGALGPLQDHPASAL